MNHHKKEIQTFVRHKALEKYILAIDPGYVNLGWSMSKVTYDTSSHKAEITVLDSGTDELCSTTDAFKPDVLAEKIATWFHSFQTASPVRLCHRKPGDPPVIVVIEGQYYKSVGSLRMVLLGTALVSYISSHCDPICSDAGIEVVPVSSSAVKKHFNIAAGDHKLNKALVVSLLAEKYGISVKNDHIGDAYLLTIYFVEKQYTI